MDTSMNRCSQLFVPLAAALLVACSGSDPVETARQALAAGQLIEAVEIASRHLERNPGDSPKTRWALERIRLEALAKSKQGDKAYEALERLATQYPAQVDAPLYLTVGAWARGAGDLAGATRILDGGAKRFPEKEKEFLLAIAEIKRSAGEMDPATTERLRSLGYLE
jgi:tetratricopeptide (TPR) repeat protein